AGHRLAAKRQISLKDLDGERMILLSQVSFVRYQIDDAFTKLGVAPHVVLETPSSSIACALVAAGAGITLVSRWTAEPFAGPDVVVKPIKEALTSRSALIFPEPGARLALAEAFAKDLREEIRHVSKRPA
ncbi:MAG: LysR substrate-binding domain-containing protein, partial [Ramlibacter sp.]